MNISDSRVLHLIKKLDLGGIEKSTISYSNYLSSEVSFVGIFAEEGFYSHSNLIDKKVELFYPAGSISNFGYYFSNLFSLIDVIRKNRINIIFYHHRIFIPFIWFVRKLMPEIKIVYTHHNVFNDPINLFLPADRFLAVSNETGRDLSNYHKSAIHIIPHGIDISHPAPRKASVIRNIGYVGRFARFKGIPVLLEAFSELIKVELEYRLLLRGEGEEMEIIRQYVLSHDLQEYVRFCAPEYNQDIIFQDIDLLVLPSTELEGFGLVVIEAMAMGIPVIASDVGGIRTILRDNYNGMLFRPNDAKQLTDKIREITDDVNLRNRLISNAYQTVLTNFSFSENIGRQMQLIKEL